MKITQNDLVSLAYVGLLANHHTGLAKHESKILHERLNDRCFKESKSIVDLRHCDIIKDGDSYYIEEIEEDIL